jgi:hypothetical protein
MTPVMAAAKPMSFVKSMATELSLNERKRVVIDETQQRVTEGEKADTKERTVLYKKGSREAKTRSK